MSVVRAVLHGRLESVVSIDAGARRVNRKILDECGGHQPGTLPAYLAQRDDWETPPDLFAQYDKRHRFNLDPCANHRNTVVEDCYIDRETNGLTHAWRSWILERSAPRVWMHPPHSECALWTRKAVIESKRGALVVALLPARTGDGWWHEFVIPYANDVRFLRGTPLFRLHRLPMVSTIGGITHAIGEASRPLPTGGFAIVTWRPER